MSVKKARRLFHYCFACEDWQRQTSIPGGAQSWSEEGRMTKGIITVATAGLILAVLGVAWLTPVEIAFPAVMALLVMFFILIGIAICRDPLGILINEQNVISLSRFQTAFWTVVVVSAFIVIAMARIKNGVIADEDSAELADPLNIALGKDLLALLGISAASLVGSPLIAATKKSKTPDQKAVVATARQMIRLDNIPDSVKAATTPPGPSSERSSRFAKPSPDTLVSAIDENAEGTLYKNPTISDASLADMFEGNEIGNAAHVDLSKVQMFFFTVVVAVAYVFSLCDVLSTNAIYGAAFAFPTLSNGMVALLGISNAGYLAAKGVDHTPKS
jgi:hypothetical protein